MLCLAKVCLPAVKLLGHNVDLLLPDERQEREENEEDDERASLVSGSRSGSISSRSSHASRKSLQAGAASQGWVSRLMGRTQNRANYQPISDGEE